jgi:hypothetical protein
MRSRDRKLEKSRQQRRNGIRLERNPVRLRLDSDWGKLIGLFSSMRCGLEAPDAGPAESEWDNREGRAAIKLYW